MANHHEVAVVLVPLPAQGHLNQLLNLSRIISYHEIQVHFVSTPTHTRQAKIRAHGVWDPLSISSLHFHEFSLPSFDTPPPDPNTKYPSQLIPLFNATIHLRDPICALLKELANTYKRVIVIHDKSHVLGQPVLVRGEPVKDLPSPDSLYPQEMAVFLAMQENSRKCNFGNLYNNSRAIEGEYLKFLAEIKLSDAENHWAVGPFNPMIIPERKTSNKYLDWLDKKPKNSVIFVSFGTTTSFSDEEIKEIAIGLEKSGQNFIWVLRDADKGDIFEGEESRKAKIPQGFEERVKERGIVIRDWAPQLEILGHCSTGGFMSHCGWNSCIESITMGVPIAAWPMHSDQPVNAILIAKVLNIGLIVREWGVRNEVLKAERVEEAVKRLMGEEEGDDMRKRAAELSSKVKDSVLEGGDSFSELQSFISHITR